MQTRYFDLRDTKGQQKEIEDKIGAAAKILRDGGLVGIPTETVYGLGANALDGTAVKRIFEAKGRPQDNPLIIHVTGAQWLPRYCADVPPLAYVLARKFWPGPLTMILKRRPIIPDETTAGLDTVAVRCPNHPVTLAIIREAGIPIAAPSANLSGRPSCTTAQDVLEDMDGRISGVVDGGPCAVGVESTILDLTCDPPRLLRPGGLPLEDLERLIGRVVYGSAGGRDLAALSAGLGRLPRLRELLDKQSRKKASVTVERICEYVTEEYADANLSLRTVAEFLKMNQAYLSTLFAQKQGVGFVDYLNQYRVDKAKILLQSTDLLIKEVGFKVGFNSTQNFNRVFKKWEGITPLQYRQAVEEEREQT